MVLAESGLTVKTIINTHGHFDHVSANQRMKEVTGAELLIHTLDAPMLSQLSATAAAWGMSSDDSPPPDRTIADGDVVQVGNITLTVIHTPGHTPGGISLHSDGAVFVGDTVPFDAAVTGCQATDDVATTDDNRNLDPKLVDFLDFIRNASHDGLVNAEGLTSHQSLAGQLQKHSTIDRLLVHVEAAQPASPIVSATS